MPDCSCPVARDISTNPLISKSVEYGGFVCNLIEYPIQMAAYILGFNNALGS